MMAASVEKEGTNVVPTTLTNPEILRYGRQMIVDGVGLPGQEGLKKSKVCTQLCNLCTVRVTSRIIETQGNVEISLQKQNVILE